MGFRAGAGCVLGLAGGTGGFVAGAVAGEAVAFGEKQPFSFDVLKAKAKALAAAPWAKVEPVAADILHKIDYDRYQEIKFHTDS